MTSAGTYARWWIRHGEQSRGKANNFPFLHELLDHGTVLRLFFDFRTEQLAGGKMDKAPNPASKTMAQLERWVRSRVDNPKDAASLKECLLAGAADNPNQASYAGKGAI